MDSIMHVTSSDVKDADYKYRPREEALDYNFVQFGSKHFTRTLSVDIDDTTDIDIIKYRIDVADVPAPTFIVKTNKGFHLHWVLELPIKARTKASFLRNRINDALIEILGGDTHAKGLRRVWRNPLKHITLHTDALHSLAAFKHIIPEKQVIKRRYAASKSRSAFVDWSKIKEGERHETLFKVISKHAYGLHHLAPKDLLAQVHNFGCYCNSQLTVPQSQNDIDSLCNSIATWVVTKYTGASDKTTAFNKKLGLHRTDKVKIKILDSFYVLLSHLKTLKDISNISVRTGGKICGVSKNTYHKYRDELYRLLIDNLKLIELNFTDLDKEIIFNERTFNDVLVIIKETYRATVP